MIIFAKVQKSDLIGPINNDNSEPITDRIICITIIRGRGGGTAKAVFASGGNTGLTKNLLKQLKTGLSPLDTDAISIIKPTVSPCQATCVNNNN